MDLPDNLIFENPDNISITTHKGRVGICFGMRFTLYMLNPHEKAIRLRIAECMEEYIRMFGDRLRWFLPVGGGKYKKFSMPKHSSLADYVNRNHSPDKDFCIKFIGGENYLDASQYNVGTMADMDRDEKDVAYITGTLPFSWLEQNEPGSFQKFVLRWCEKLSPYHGYAGVGIITSYDYDEARRTEELAYPFAMRFPGLDLDYPPTLTRFLMNGIKGVNWLTVINDELSDRVGGKESLRKQLGEGFLFYDYPGGCMIQAGPSPQIGDVNRKNIPVYYRKLGSILKPLRAEYEDRYLQAPKGIDSMEKTREWFARFD